MRKNTKNADLQDIQRKNIGAIDGTPSNIILNNGLISRMSSMSYDELKDEFVDILNRATAIKDESRRAYIAKVEKIAGHTRLMRFIADFVLAGDRLSTDLKNYSMR